MDLPLRALTTALAALTMALTWAGCAPPAEDTLIQARERGFLRAGFADEAPYAHLDAGGRVVGESAEALLRVAGELGVDSVRWLLLDFSDLLPALEAGRVDVVAAGQFVTPERERVARFVRPTVCVRAALLHRADRPPPPDLTSFADDGEERLAVIDGAVEEEAARRQGVPEGRLLVVPDVATGVAAVEGGGAAALALTGPSARAALALHPGRSSLTWHPYEPAAAVAHALAGCSALAFRLEDEALAVAADGVLARYVGSAAHLEVLARYAFGPANVPEGTGTGLGEGG